MGTKKGPPFVRSTAARTDVDTKLMAMQKEITKYTDQYLVSVLQPSRGQKYISLTAGEIVTVKERDRCFP